MNDNLKPVIFVQGMRQFYSPNSYAQTILLQAMQNGVTDPQEMRRIAGLKTVADVYRTLDKLAIRREYHEALARQGVTLDGIVSGINQISTSSESDAVRLKGYQTLLRSVGLDKYEKQEDAGKSWEELIVNTFEQKKEKSSIIDAEYDDYKVISPVVPDAEKERRAQEREVGKDLYEGKY